MEICTVGSVRGESVGLAMVDLNGHEAGNGGHSQGKPIAYWDSSTRREAIFQQPLARTLVSLSGALAKATQLPA